MRSYVTAARVARSYYGTCLVRVRMDAKHICSEEDGVDDHIAVFVNVFAVGDVLFEVLEAKTLLRIVGSCTA